MALFLWRKSMLDFIFYASGVVLGVLVAVYFYFFFGRYARLFRQLFKKTPTKNQNVFFKVIQIILCVGLGVTMIFISYTPALIVGHFFAFFLIFDVVFWLIKLVFKKKQKVLDGISLVHYSRILPIIVCVALLTYGAININRIYETKYTFETTKIERQEGYKIVLISDAHYGTVQDRDVFVSAIDRIDAISPDLVILAGDITDEGTSKEEMLEVFSLLGGIDSKYGTYFIYGNHDRQMYSSEKNRTYTDAEMYQAMTDNGIKVLIDQAELINEELLIIGREDPSNDEDRKSVAEIIEGYDASSLYTLILDHQPEKDNFNFNAQQGYDLQLSGHTHGGQIFPTGAVISLTGTPNYGQYDVDDFSAIVSSGITGWGYPFRTEGICEFCTITITPAD